MACKWLYPEVARQYGTNWKCVERNIRTVISVAWKNNPELMEKFAQRPLVKKPTVSMFIAFLSTYIRS